VGKSDFLLFGLPTSRPFAEKVALSLGISLSPHEEQLHKSGEYEARPLVNVRNRHVAVLHSLYGEAGASATDKLCQLLFFIGALKEASAASVTAVVPYLCYARKHGEAEPRDPVMARHAAALFDAVGTDRIVTIDAEDQRAFRCAFRGHSEQLEATSLFVDYFANVRRELELVIVSTETHAIEHAEHLRRALATRTGRPVGAAFVERYWSGGSAQGEGLVGKVNGCVAVVFDHVIETGETVARAARACRAQGAAHVYAAATHGLFVEGASELADGVLDRIIVTNTVPPLRLSPKAAAGCQVLEVSGLVAEALRRIHSGDSLVDLVRG
jgi:ribose-phosphate pyrophosphokinase